MAVDLSLLLQNAYTAFANGQTHHGLFLLNYAIRLESEALPPSHLPLDAAIALDAGFARNINEDCIFALQGTLPETQDVFGFFVVCDGMGGHAHGLHAAHLAIQTIVEFIFPRLIEHMPSRDWTRVLAEGVQTANRAIYLRNQSMQAQNEIVGIQVAQGTDTVPSSLMGTTVTAALLLGDKAYVVNVGDSRTYLYQPAEGLTRITVDHSWVANLFNLAENRITPEEIYTHPYRNRIFRALGHSPSVEVDTFTVSLQEDAVLLLCSDGLWEMTRDPRIEEILRFDWASAPYMANRLLALAKEGGAHDNIGLVVVQASGRQRRDDIGNMATIIQPVDALTRLVPTSSYTA